MTPLPTETFKLVVEHAPLVSIDLIVRNGGGEMLLGLRRNQPARGYWFVPGGRLRKNERIPNAFRRLTGEELGTPLDIGRTRFLGVFEHLYTDNFSGESGFGTHYVVLAYELDVDAAALHLPDAQHSGYRWLDDAAILHRDDVHANTKAYCALARP